MSSVRKIALQAGCSIATVSLALRGDRSISEATAIRIRSTANKLGYKYIPKPSPSSANPNQRHFVLVTSAWTDRPFPVYAAVIDGIADACRELDVRFSLHQLKTAECVVTLSAMACDGIIYGMADALIEQALIEKIRSPLVKVMSLPGINWPYDHVTYNNSMIGYVAGNYLVKNGHHRVALVDTDNPMFNERINGAREIIEQNGGQIDTLRWPAAGFINDMNESAGVFFAALRTNKVTALFSPGDSFTISIYQMLLHQGIRPGRDIEVFSCNNENILEQLDPRPLSVDIHARSVGRMAVRQLLWRVENPKEPAITLQISPTLSDISNQTK